MKIKWRIYGEKLLKSVLHWNRILSLTFFIMPVFRLEKVVYLLNLLSINSIFIFTRPFVFFPWGTGVFAGLCFPRPIPGAKSSWSPRWPWIRGFWSVESSSEDSGGSIMSSPAPSALRFMPAWLIGGRPYCRWGSCNGWAWRFKYNSRGRHHDMIWYVISKNCFYHCGS